MHRIDTEGAVPDLHGPGKSGFRNRNLSTGVKATIPDAAMWNAVQEALMLPVEAAAPISGVSLLESILKMKNQEALGGIWTTNATGWGANTIYNGAYNAGRRRHVLVGQSPRLMTVDNFTTYTARTPAGAYAGTFFGVAINEASNIVVAGGISPNANGLQRSTDGGNTWVAAATVPAASQTVNAILWSVRLGLFISVGNSGQIQTSPDGNVWTARTSGTANSLICICETPTHVIVGGSSGGLRRSTDGINWTATTTTFTSGHNIDSLVYDPASKVAVALGRFTGSINFSRHSTDNGDTWSTLVNMNTQPAAFSGGTQMSHSLAIDNLIVTANFGGQVAWSHNGLNWYPFVTNPWPDATNIRAIICPHRPGLVGVSGRHITSPLNWR